jgi:Na+-transporting methylmalonyl-CoA/oxaloacetate decarboxylase gamma subunit
LLAATLICASQVCADGGWSAISEGGGWTLMAVGMSVVFSGLVLLFLFLRVLAVTVRTYHDWRESRDMPRAPEAPSGEMIAAVAMALSYALRRASEEETAIVTITRIARPYSPWSSKIYGLRRTPHGEEM